MKQYYYLDEDNQTRGPVTLGQLSAMMVEGLVNPTTLVVEVGGKNWLALGGVLSCGYILPPPPGSEPAMPNICPRCKKEIQLRNGGIPFACPHCRFRMAPNRPGLWANFFFIISQCLTLRGRTPRRDFWFFQVIFLAISIILAYCGITLLEVSLSEEGNLENGIMWLTAGGVFFLLVFILWLLLALPQMTLMVRRLHDTGWSGKWVLLHAGNSLVFLLSLLYCSFSMIFIIATGMERAGTDCESAKMEFMRPPDCYPCHAYYWTNKIRAAERANKAHAFIESCRPIYNFIAGTNGIHIDTISKHVLVDLKSGEEFARHVTEIQSVPPHGFYIAGSLLLLSGCAVPILTIMLLLLSFTDSQRGPNRYGPSFKYPRG